MSLTVDIGQNRLTSFMYSQPVRSLSAFLYRGKVAIEKFLTVGKSVERRPPTSRERARCQNAPSISDARPPPRVWGQENIGGGAAVADLHDAFDHEFGTRTGANGPLLNNQFDPARRNRWITGLT
jgi:hypothetical protein